MTPIVAEVIASHVVRDVKTLKKCSGGCVDGLCIVQLGCNGINCNIHSLQIFLQR